MGEVVSTRAAFLFMAFGAGCGLWLANLLHRRPSYEDYSRQQTGSIHFVVGYGVAPGHGPIGVGRMADQPLPGDYWVATYGSEAEARAVAVKVRELVLKRP